MRIGIIATRLSGTDGVSLEVAKWVQVLRNAGHELYYCAGELGGYAATGTLIPRMHFTDREVYALTQAAFAKKNTISPEQLLDEILRLSAEMKAPLLSFIRENQLDCLIVQNVLAIPMNLPLAHCITEISAESDIPVVAHNHDYYWERERYQISQLPSFLETYFPADLPNVKHVSINSIAQQRLKRRRGIDSVVIPNVFDFEKPVPELTDKRQSFRSALKLSTSEPLIVQPTRVIQRKGIELAIELLCGMDMKHPKLFITHAAGDEGLDYWHWIQHEARMMGVELILADQFVKDTAGPNSFTLADVYLNANLVTYPSLYEGFGNALIEAVYFKRPVVVNRYPVYNSDIRPLGFNFIELEGYVDDAAIKDANQMIHSMNAARDIVENNFEIARKHFSMETLETKLLNVLEKLI
ncbi:MAG: glycosyltransferase family 4 protein [Anaerolineaceae bacterium]|nr:glycosyltransferase family 4 protein [Anaerolineaceae bacterium]